MNTFYFQSQGAQGPMDFRVPRCTEQHALAFEGEVDKVCTLFGYPGKFDAEARGQYSGYSLAAGGKMPTILLSALRSHPGAKAPHLDVAEYDAQGADLSYLMRMHNAAGRAYDTLGQILLYRTGLRGYQTSYEVQYCDEQRQLAGAAPEFQKVYDIVAPTWDKMQADRVAAARANERLVADQKLSQDDLLKELQASRRQTELVQDELRRAMQLLTQLQAQQARPAPATPAIDDKRRNDR